MTDRTARIASLTCYPIKGCRGIDLDTGYLGAAGLVHDRVFALVNPAGKVLTQRQFPLLATVEVTPEGGTVTGTDDGVQTWRVSAPGAEDLRFTTNLDGAELTGTHFTHLLRGVDQGAPIAEWFGRVLDTECRLITVPRDNTRRGAGITGGPVGFADAAAVLVISESSLALLNQKITGGGAEAVPMDRFRPNIVVAGWDEPHTEDGVSHLAVGGGELGWEVPAKRCKVITIDQRSGVVTGGEPLATLSTYRRQPPTGVYFGCRFAVTRTGALSVGDAVTIVSGLPDC